MPIRQGYFGGGVVQQILHGLAAGANEGAGDVVRVGMQKRQSDLESQRALMKDTTDKLIAGQMEPDQGYALMAAHGIPTPPGLFEKLTPSATSRLQSVLKGTTAETTPEEFNIGLGAKDMPPMAGTFSTPPELRMPGGFDDQSNDVAAKAFAARQEAFTRAQKPEVTGHSMIGEGADSQPAQTFEQFSPLSGNFANPVTRSTGPTAGQAGAAAGAQQLAEAPGKGAAEAAVENATRDAKVQTSRAQEQGQIDVRTSPANTRAQANYEAALRTAATQAELKARQAGFTIKPGLTTTSTGLAYLDLGKFEGADKQVAARLAGQEGLPIVNDQDAGFLRDIDMARQVLSKVQDIYTHLPAQSRTTLAGLAGASEAKINAALQADPELAAIKSYSLGAIGLMRAAGGGRGLRVNRLEFENAAGAIDPVGKFLVDSAPVFLGKIHNLGGMLYSNELSTILTDRTKLPALANPPQQQR